MKILVLNGPNINMIGIREKSIYGTMNYDSIVAMIHEDAALRNIEVEVRQSNHEGVLVDWIQEAYFTDVDGLIINPGAYTHTSIAILDALKAIAPIPAVEIHLSDIMQRESFRHVSYPAMACIAQVKGKGAQGYVEAMDVLIDFIRSSAESEA